MIIITFHPFADHHKSAQVLDYRRLGNQRQEALQILKALLGIVGSYKSIPAERSWRDYERALCEYGIIICEEWIRRGYVDNTKIIFEIIRFQRLEYRPIIDPPWIGNERYHANQRAILLGKNFNWYSQFRWLEQPTDTYWFP